MEHVPEHCETIQQYYVVASFVTYAKSVIVTACLQQITYFDFWNLM